MTIRGLTLRVFEVVLLFGVISSLSLPRVSQADPVTWAIRSGFPLHPILVVLVATLATLRLWAITLA